MWLSKVGVGSVVTVSYVFFSHATASLSTACFSCFFFPSYNPSSYVASNAAELWRLKAGGKSGTKRDQVSRCFNWLTLLDYVTMSESSVGLTCFDLLFVSSLFSSSQTQFNILRRKFRSAHHCLFFCLWYIGMKISGQSVAFHQAAQTIRTKVQFDFYELPADSYGSLRIRCSTTSTGPKKSSVKASRI